MDLTFTDSHVTCGGASRPLSADDLATLEGIRIPQDPTPANLLDLGRRLFRWLDGPGRWLSTPPTDRLVIRAPKDSPTWKVPWEVMADDEGHLVARGAGVVRRRRDPGEGHTLRPYRLGLLFMAAAPEGHSPLLFEDEEAAILRAVREPAAATGIADPASLPATELDLFGEDTGTLDELVRRLDVLQQQPEAPQQDRRLDVLHLSCHGTAGSPPILALETESGELDEVDGDRLVDRLRPHLPAIPLIFVSACETGVGDVAASLADRLIDAGAPAVVAWGGRVFDQDATAFAAWLYHHLARGFPLDKAFALAQRELLRTAAPHWHLARLCLGSSTAGPLAPADGAMRPVNPLRNEIYSRDVVGRPRPVCNEAAFVGRRLVMQRALRALRDGKRRGIVITGIGQQGKSSLAVRLADRLRGEFKPVMIWGKLEALHVRSQIAREIGEPSTEGGERQHQLADRDADVASLRAALKDWLADPRKRFLLILDDFEQNLEDIGTAIVPTREANPVVQAILEEFRANPGTQSRLIVTSRTKFVAVDNRDNPLQDSLEVIEVPQMEPHERARLRAPREVVLLDHRRAERLGHGNPGLTEILLRLAAADKGAFEATCAALDKAGPANAGDGIDEQVIEALKNIAIEALVEQASRRPAASYLLQVSQLFDLPVPEEVIIGLARVLGVDDPRPSLRWLSDLGVLEPRARDLLALNSLVAAHLSPRLPEERQALLPEALDLLRTHDLGRDPIVAVQAFLLAAERKDVDLLVRTTEVAIPLLDGLDDPRRTGPLAIGACRLLVEHNHPCTSWILMQAAALARRSPEPLDDILAAARERLEAGDHHTEASLLLLEGRALAQRGEPEEALDRLARAEAIFLQINDARSRAVTLGDIARIRVDTGEVDEALRLHTERLAVFERLGEAREQAVTLGDIARIRVSKGEVDEALRLHTERLGIVERLGDAREWAFALGDIARIRAYGGEVDEALRHQLDVLEVFERLGDLRSRAVTLGHIARVRAMKGEFDKALRLHEEELAVYERLGDARSRAVTLGDIARILALNGEVDEALRLHTERLAVFERLGDACERAVTLGDIAHIRASKGEVDEALRLHTERLAVFERLGDADGLANSLWDLAQIDLARGDLVAAKGRLDRAFPLLRRIGPVGAIAVVGSVYGQVLAATGEGAGAREVLGLALEAWRRLGRAGEAEQVAAMLKALEATGSGPGSDGPEEPGLRRRRRSD
ncbi:MAG TPA: tetratricopeptide repeat protein [Phycisphaerales bacterium]|nr:tetratricopeptide repeat protein [Phycisphaerales bacterium]HMP36994.1 tetratricopeptide repeat protein [Phycisphaerales bacterium]